MKNFYLNFTILLLSVFGLLFAFFLQVEVNLIPCKLCIWQRWPHFFNILIVLMILTLTHKTSLLFFVGLTNVTFGVALSIYHLGFVKGYWNNVFSCSGVGDIENLSVEELLNNIKNTSISSCNNIQWYFLEISLVDWSAILFIIISILWILNIYYYYFSQDSN